ncbi:hypothetical protein B0T17DRAFT_617301 [Bombardia bombarda]|uniref:Uncharacterized protein n=1 Tax=Bombardia bombarda TaxID=252184 RepID=A0AA39X0S8_9PEZI|nr:hypothetical protein B0T17DRAFT_617301 [Bombardia bombarda]
MYSKVGTPSIYEDDNQRKISKSDIAKHSLRSNVNVMGYRPKDQIDAVNALDAKEIMERTIEAMKKDPTLAATLHGNKPSKGAMIDKELQMEEEEMMKRKSISEDMMMHNKGMSEGMTGSYNNNNNMTPGMTRKRVSNLG